ncbi:MAG: hypothetical protein QOE64_350 [Frankiales bacterium]|nr:hypothetical protein [Frankiales bacterium]
MVQVHLGPLAHARPDHRSEGNDVKKKILVLLAAVGGLVAFKKRAKARSEAELWQEATRPAPDLR